MFYTTLQRVAELTNKSEIFVEAFMCRVCVSLAAKRSEEINGSTLLKKERKTKNILLNAVNKK